MNEKNAKNDVRESVRVDAQAKSVLSALQTQKNDANHRGTFPLDFSASGTGKGEGEGDDTDQN